MQVRAKFKVDSVLRNMTGATIELRPVINGSVENEKFYKYTPSGHIQLSTVNDEAAAQFEPGDEFYVDFTRAT